MQESKNYLKFSKWEGLGNDFVLIESCPNPNSAELARTICNRHLGVGADGLIYLFRNDQGTHMEIFNSDGTVANMCGNGIRCLAAQAMRLGWVKTKEAASITTRSGCRTVKVLINHNPALVEVDMGTPIIEDVCSLELPNLHADSIEKLKPIAAVHQEEGDAQSQTTEKREKHHKFVAVKVDMGNPHLVVFLGRSDIHSGITHLKTADFSWPDIALNGSWLERAQAPEHGINVEFVIVECAVNGTESSDTHVASPAPEANNHQNQKADLYMRVWERGVGETQACGTGACAVFAAAHHLQLCNEEANVHLLGGDLHTSYNGDHLKMLGAARLVYEGSWPLE